MKYMLQRAINTWNHSGNLIVRNLIVLRQNSCVKFNCVSQNLVLTCQKSIGFSNSRCSSKICTKCLL